MADFKYELESLAITKCKLVIEYYKKYGRQPSNAHHNNELKKLGHWISVMRSAKANESRGYIFYPIIQKMVEDAGFPYIFDKIDYNLHAAKICMEVIDYTKKNGFYPSTLNVDSNVRKLSYWLGRVRSANKGVGSSKMYSNLIQISVNEGLPHMFTEDWRDDLYKGV